MAHYNPVELSRLCKIYASNQCTINKERKTTEKITKRASLLKNEYIKKAHEEFDRNLINYQSEALDPTKIFKLKKQNSYGFYKEYLESPIIQKYIKRFPEIYANKENITELDEETKKFTNGKAKSFQQYYDDALQENAYRIINKIAIQLILADLQELEEQYDKQQKTEKTKND